MDFCDPLDVAQVAIPRVSDIASRLGVEKRRPICGRLGAELLILASFLEYPSPGQEERLRPRITKLLKDVEKICSWPQKSAEYHYPSLLAIAEAAPTSSFYTQAESRIRHGLEAFTSENYDLAENFISHINRFIKDKGITKLQPPGQGPVPPRAAPADYPNDMNMLLYKILHEHHVCCTCIDKTDQKAQRRRHLARLLLKPAQHPAEDGHVQFDMLFSSKPFCSEPPEVHWQDVQLLIPQIQNKKKKRARFADYDNDVLQLSCRNGLKRVDRGRFCELIRLEVNSRLCLTIQDGKLRQFEEFQPMKQLVQHVPSISLATVLQSYHLTPKMKGTLAYILARSVWQFYDSDWMKTKWTTESIQFMREYCPNGSGGWGDLFAWKPYFSVRFGEADSEFAEFSNADGEIHRYPRVRALGIMLVEIGIGSPIRRGEEGLSGRSQTVKINDDWSLAIQYSDCEKPWPDFDYRKYRTAVKNCLDPGVFTSAPYVQGQSEKEYQDGLSKRRNILYDRVIFPLEEFFHGTGWADELATIGPMQSESRPPPVAPALEPSPPTDGGKNDTLNSQKKSSSWLSRMDRINSELLQSARLQNISQCRIRIAILDTGYDDDAPFFHFRRNRLKGWKDWVDGLDKPQDCNGHGTHVVSLVMRVAPEADIYVARVAKDPKRLVEASDNVAKAIDWAHTKWNADIVSMSFGYAQEKHSISRAIRSAVNDRDNSILFFAAAANSGANEKEMFPARHESVISVRGTNAKGEFEDFNPPRNQDEAIVYGTLGLDVPSAWLRDYAGVMHKSGTSMATAIAAGMAAMLLGYVNGKRNEITFQDVERKLRTRQGMLAMFRSIATLTMKEGYFYVAPWSLMGISEETRWAKVVAAVSDI